MTQTASGEARVGGAGDGDGRGGPVRLRELLRPWRRRGDLACRPGAGAGPPGIVPRRREAGPRHSG